MRDAIWRDVTPKEGIDSTGTDIPRAFTQRLPIKEMTFKGNSIHLNNAKEMDIRLEEEEINTTVMKRRSAAGWTQLTSAI